MINDSHFKFRLYVAGAGPHSTQAILNLNTICAEHLPNRHEIEVVDVTVDQGRALSDGVMLTPLLIRLSPGPVLKIAGTLSRSESVVRALGLHTTAR
jgi:circadian clock protein KaiB